MIPLQVGATPDEARSPPSRTPSPNYLSALGARASCRGLIGWELALAPKAWLQTSLNVDARVNLAARNFMAAPGAVGPGGLHGMRVQTHDVAQAVLPSKIA